MPRAERKALAEVAQYLERCDKRLQRNQQTDFLTELPSKLKRHVSHLPVAVQPLAATQVFDLSSFSALKNAVDTMTHQLSMARVERRNEIHKNVCDFWTAHLKCVQEALADCEHLQFLTVIIASASEQTDKYQLYNQN